MDAELTELLEIEEKRRARVKYLWQKVRDKYKPSMTKNSFYALYKVVMEHRKRAHQEFDDIKNKPLPYQRGRRLPESDSESEDHEEEEWNAGVRPHRRLTLVERQKHYAFLRLTLSVHPQSSSETEVIRDITGEDLGCLLMAWIRNVKLSLYKLADKIYLVTSLGSRKTVDELIGELSLLMMTALMTRDWNHTAWPEYKDWRMELNPDGTAVSPVCYWAMLREYKMDMLGDMQSVELHRLLYSGAPRQRQLLFRNMNKFFVEEIRKLSDSGQTHPSKFVKYQSIEQLLDLGNVEKYSKLEPKPVLREPVGEGCSQASTKWVLDNRWEHMRPEQTGRIQDGFGKESSLRAFNFRSNQSRPQTVGSQMPPSSSHRLERTRPATFPNIRDRDSLRSSASLPRCAASNTCESTRSSTQAVNLSNLVHSWNHPQTSPTSLNSINKSRRCTTSHSSIRPRRRHTISSSMESFTESDAQVDLKLERGSKLQAADNRVFLSFCSSSGVGSRSFTSVHPYVVHGKRTFAAQNDRSLSPSYLPELRS